MRSKNSATIVTEYTIKNDDLNEIHGFRNPSFATERKYAVLLFGTNVIGAG